MPDPQWKDGEPLNTEAALMDALEWLEVMVKLRVLWYPKHAESRERLQNCITAAKRFLPAQSDPFDTPEKKE